jgi:transcriptional regulator with XRE-family HTH domain
MVMKIRELRENMGLTQQQLASRCGVAQSVVSAWEAEINLPRTKQLPHLAKILDVPIEDLFEEQDL